ncbi:MAG TPA: hypothetical protein VN522_08320 [Solirubrobacterales bacterium]|nr:hypothetical protein [Solirubrobacterales bacterium]
MDERDRDRQAIDALPEGTGRLRAGVDLAHASADRVRGAGDRFRDAGEDAAWFLRERIVWPAQDGLDSLGPRGQIGVFGGGGIAVAGVVAALLIAGGGSGSGGGTTEAFVVPERTPTPAALAPAPEPKKQKPAKPTGPTLHGAPPDFSAAQDVRSKVGDGKAVGKEAVDGEPGGVVAERGAGNTASDGGQAKASANEAPAATAKIGSTPEATASAAAQAESLSNDEASGAAQGNSADGAEDGSELSGPPAPKAAKRVARHFAEAFVVYETGGVDAKVRNGFRRTTTKQLARALLQRPPRQPAAVKVPRAKVVTVVAGPSQDSVYEVSVSLLRVGVTSELRLQMEQGPGKKWQVTNVLG